MRGSGTRARARRPPRHRLRRVVQPDDGWVVTAGPTKAGLWDATTGEFLYFLQGQRGPLRAAAFDSPTRIVTSGADGVRARRPHTCGGRDALLRQAETRLRETGG